MCTNPFRPRERRIVKVCILHHDQFFIQGLWKTIVDFVSSPHIAFELLPSLDIAQADCLFINDTDGEGHNYCRISPDFCYRFVIRAKETRSAKSDPAWCRQWLEVISYYDRPETAAKKIKDALRQGVTAVERPAFCALCAPVTALSKRELTILKYFYERMTPSVIGRFLNLSIKSVSNYKRGAMLKLGLRNNNELYQWLNQNGCIFNSLSQENHPL